MKAAVIMGSMSDLEKVTPCVELLQKFGAEVQVRCLSAHRASAMLHSFMEEVNENGTEVVVAAAGMAAALPGVVAAQTTLPVIGVPLSGSVLDGQDALFSIVQMPPGIPVATVAINGAKNAAWLALEIMSIKYPELRDQLRAERKKMEQDAEKANAEVSARFKQ